MRAADKIVAREELARRLPQLRAAQGKVVFTNGVFDLLHVGHVRYLEFARALGGLLVVGVNSDASVRQLGKAPGRPVVPQAERAEVVAALASVDFVCIFDELRPDATIRALRPDVHVKSAEYAGTELPEAGAVRDVGGEIVFAPHVEGSSTTALLDRVEAAARPKGRAPHDESAGSKDPAPHGGSAGSKDPAPHGGSAGSKDPAPRT